MKPLKRVNNDIARLEKQSTEIKTRLEDLYKQRTQLENTEMIAAIRDAEFDASDVVAVIQAIKKGGSNLSELLSLATNQNHTNPATTKEEHHENESY